MSQPQPEEPDPLLGFSLESTDVVPPIVPAEPVKQPELNTGDALPPSSLSRDVQAAVDRVDLMQRSLDDSKAEVASLKSEVATLVRALEDIKRQVSRAPVLIKEGRPSKTFSWTRAASAAAALVIGLSVAVLSWVNFTRADTTIATPEIKQAAIAPVVAQLAAAEPTPVTPPVSPPPPAPAPPERAPAARTPVAPAPVAPAPAAAPPPARASIATPKPVTYVGTLSIDAAPSGEVFVDRKAAGRTPLRLTNLRAGSHLIWVERDGYRRWTRVVQVPADRVSRVSAELEPIAVR